MKRIIERFAIDADIVTWAPYGSGHINRTYLLTGQEGEKYILQRINGEIFHDVPALMGNIVAVTNHLRSKGLTGRRVLTIVPARTGESYVHFSEGDETAPAGWYRVYEFIDDALCLNRCETREDFRQSAAAFGSFQRALSDFDAGVLTETIPHFHDTVDRFARLRDAIRRDPLDRAKEVRREIDFALEREAEAGTMVRMGATGALPLRVTHNDTKLNNVMLDRHTRTALCVIDLDTVMPGLAGNDFGDSIRFGASTGAEDETDLRRVEMSTDLYRAYAEGFLSECGGSLTPNELDTLPLAAKLMTLECGIRFLTDYLEGDVYFHIARPAHNLDRTRTQLRLVADMEKKWDAMGAIIAETAAKYH